MGILDGLLKDGVSVLGGAVGGLAKDIRTAITGKEAITSEEREKIFDATHQIEVMALQADQAINQGQIDLNKLDAMSPSLFRSGWRPFVGWVCGLGLAYQFLARPIVPWIVGLWHQGLAPMPSLEMGTLLTLLGGLLGLGVARTVEKINGIN